LPYEAQFFFNTKSGEDVMKTWISAVTLCLVFLSANAFAQNTNGHKLRNNQSQKKNLFQHKKQNLTIGNFHPRIRHKPRMKPSILPKKYVVVPNRSDSTLTILATPSGKILKKITAEDTGFEFEPIYASSLAKFKMIAVSDRMNSQLMFFDSRTFKFLGTVPTSTGMFHMWPTPEQNELFAVADIDRVIDVVKVRRFGNRIFSRHRMIDVGEVTDTGKPHDIMVDKTHVYVTMLGIEGEDGIKEDLVLKYNRRSLKLEGKLKFSFDIHLGMPLQSPYLLVPETTTGKLNFIDKKSFKVVTVVDDLPGAHGIWWNSDASKVYLANFDSQGPEAIYEVRQTLDDEEFRAVKNSTHDLADAKAHNMTVDFVNQVMFITHSGPNIDGQLNRNVSIFSVAGKPRFIKTVESGANPLGILLVDR
jgi:hypothetical protein